MPATRFSSPNPTGEGAIMDQLRKAREDRMAPPVVEKAKPEPVFKSAYADEEGTIYAIAATSDTVDLDDDMLSSKALVQMAHDFTSSDKRTFKANHDSAIGATLVASMTGSPILKSGRRLERGANIPIDDPVIGLDISGDQTCWVVGLKPDDKAVVELAKAGGIAGLSWGAFAHRDGE